MYNSPKDKNISLSSWNYGCFSLTNPYYNTHINNKPINPTKVFQNQYTNFNNNIKNNERIVQNIFFENQEYMNYISRDSELKNKRANSAKPNVNKSNNNNIEYRKTFQERKKEKDIFLKKDKMLKKKKLEEENKNKTNNNNYIDISFKKWINNKNKIKKEEKEKKIEEEKMKNDEKARIDKDRREKMEIWLQDKKNLEISNNKKKKKKEKIIRIKNEKMKKEKEEICKENFKEWVIKKGKEKRKKKINNEENNNNNKNIKRKYSQVIGSYTYSKIIRQMQNYYNNDKNKNNINEHAKRNNTVKK